MVIGNLPIMSSQLPDNFNTKKYGVSKENGLGRRRFGFIIASPLQVDEASIWRLMILLLE